MLIAGLAKQSFVDYPGKIAAVIFTQGCNLNCFYCHNRQLIPWESKTRQIAENEILEFLSQRRNFLEGVVITGGEPTLQEDLPEFITQIKEQGYPVKLDTNGTQPDMLRKLLEAHLLDYVAMDLKAPASLFYQICGVQVNQEDIRDSINLLLDSTLPHEFRTTWAPGLSQDDIREILLSIPSTSPFFLQNYRKQPHSTTAVPDLELLAVNFPITFSNCQLRGF